MKEFLKLVAPYLTAILTGVGVYVDGQTKIAMLEYKVEQVQNENGGLRDDVKGIKDLLYAIDTKISVYGVQLEERTKARK